MYVYQSVSGVFHHDSWNKFPSVISNTSKALKAGESYVLCVDYDGSGSLGFANAYDDVPRCPTTLTGGMVRVDRELCYI